MPTVGERRAAYEAFLARPFVTAFAWERSLSAAIVKAEERGCAVFAYFTRCHEPCAEAAVFEEGVFLSEWFRRRASEFVLYLDVETRLPDGFGAGEAVAVALAESVAPAESVALADPWVPQAKLIGGAGPTAARIAFSPTDEAALDRAVELLAALGDVSEVLSRDHRNEAAIAALGLIRALTGEDPPDIATLDRSCAVPGVDPRVLRQYERARAWLIVVDHRLQIDRVLQKYGREGHPAAVKPIRDGEIYAQYRRGVEVPIDGEPTLQYCDSIICGAMDRGDRETAARYLPAAEAAANRAIASYRREAERNPAVSAFATRMIGYFEGKIAFLRERAAR